MGGFRSPDETVPLQRSSNVLVSINEFVSGPLVYIENHKKFSRECKCFIKSIRGPRKLKVGPFKKILANNGGGVEGTG